MNKKNIKGLAAFGLAVGAMALVACGDATDSTTNESGNKPAYEEPVDIVIPTVDYNCDKDAECVTLWRAYDGEGVQSETVQGYRWKVLSGSKPTFKALDGNGRDYNIDIIPDDITPLVSKVGGLYAESSDGVGLYINVDSGELADSKTVSGIDLLVGASGKTVLVSICKMDGNKIVGEYKALVTVSSTAGKVSVPLSDFKHVSGDENFDKFLKEANAIVLRTPDGTEGSLIVAGIGLYHSEVKSSSSKKENSSSSEKSESVKSSSSAKSETTSSSSSVNETPIEVSSSSSDEPESSSSEESHYSWLWRGDSPFFIPGNNGYGFHWVARGEDLIIPASIVHEDSLNPLMIRCSGVCAKYVPSETHAYTVGIMTPEDKPADIVDWGGLCIAYTSEVPILVETVSNVDGGVLLDTLEASATLNVRNIKWNVSSKYFEHIAGILLARGDNRGGIFNIRAIGSYGECSNLTLEDSQSPIRDSDYLLSEDYLNSSVVYGTLTDDRDGQKYHTVKVGNLNWMAQNLNLETNKSFCPENAVNTCDKYGRLYSWSAAVDSAGIFSSTMKGCGDGAACEKKSYFARGICPSGWHLPNMAEMESISSLNEGASCNGEKIRSAKGWYNYQENTEACVASDDYGFSLVPAGIVLFEDFSSYASPGTTAELWTSDFRTESGSDTKNAHAAYYYMSMPSGEVVGYTDRSNFISVRCVEDYELEKKTVRHDDECYSLTVNPMLGTAVDSTKMDECPIEMIEADDFLSKDAYYGNLVDARDGHMYKTVQIGKFMWMAQNLNYLGDDASLKDDRATCGIYTYNGISHESCDLMGGYYTWSAAIDSAKYSGNGKECGAGKEPCQMSVLHRGVCPEGWHLPASFEYSDLLKTIKNEGYDANALLSTFGKSWTQNTDAKPNNKTGFSAIYAFDIWGAEDIDDVYAQAYFIRTGENGTELVNGLQAKSGRSHVRCVEDYPLEKEAVRVDDVCYVRHTVYELDILIEQETLEKCPRSLLTIEDYLSEDVSYGSVLDIRDGKTYKTVTIGEYEWMAQNLNYYDPDNASLSGNRSKCLDYAYNGDVIADCQILGRAYTWAAAIDSANIKGQTCGADETECTLPAQHRGICPEGWHLPTLVEYNGLLDEIGGESDNVNAVLSTFDNQWEDTGAKPTNESGFSLIHPSTGQVYLWRSDLDESFFAKVIFTEISEDHQILSTGSTQKPTMNYIRCVKDYAEK